MTYCKDSVTCASVIVSVRECEIITYAGKCDICRTEEKKEEADSEFTIKLQQICIT